MSRWRSPDPEGETNPTTAVTPAPLSTPIEPQADTNRGQHDFVDFTIRDMPDWDASFYDCHQWFSDAFPLAPDQGWIYDTIAGQELGDTH